MLSETELGARLGAQLAAEVTDVHAAPDLLRTLRRRQARRNRMMVAGVAAPAAAAIAAVCTMTLVPRAAAPPAGQTRGQSANAATLQLMAAAEATGASTYRFTSSFSVNGRPVRQTTGAWDPVAHQGYSNQYDSTGTLVNQKREIGDDGYELDSVKGAGRWYHFQYPWQEVSSIFLLGDEAPVVRSGSVTCTPNPETRPTGSASHDTGMACDIHVPWKAPGTTQLRSLIEALRDSGSPIWDMGVAGTGATAVHSYGFRVHLTLISPLMSPTPHYTEVPRLETGTIEVNAASDRITKVTWSIPRANGNTPDDTSTSTWTVEYSGYGLPVQVPRPEATN
jgi:hypothetical protein